MLSNLAYNPDPSCLTIRQAETNFMQFLSLLKIEADKKFSRRQFFWRAKGKPLHCNVSFVHAQYFVSFCLRLNNLPQSLVKPINEFQNGSESETELLRISFRPKQFSYATIRAPDKVHKITFNRLCLCYFFTKSYV